VAERKISLYFGNLTRVIQPEAIPAHNNKKVLAKSQKNKENYEADANLIIALTAIKTNCHSMVGYEPPMLMNVEMTP
jgi:hypothetical protein